MKLLRSRLFTLIVAGAAGVVSQVNPEWGGLLYGALAALGWAVPHPSDRKPQ